MIENSGTVSLIRQCLSGEAMEWASPNLRVASNRAGALLLERAEYIVAIESGFIQSLQSVLRGLTSEPVKTSTMTTQSIDSLGPLTKSWSPGSLSKDPCAGKNLPFWFMPVQVVVVFASLFLCLSGAVVIYVQILKPMNLYPGILWGGLVFAVLFVPPMFLLHWIGQQLVNRNELAVHRNGVRWAKNVVLFDQIQSLSMGTQTFNETHFPTLNELWKAHWRHGEAMKKAEEKERAATLAFHLKDGTAKQWRNLGQCFPPQTLEEFFAKLVDGFDV